MQHMNALQHVLQPTPEQLALQRAALERIAEEGIDPDSVADLTIVDEEKYVGDSRGSDYRLQPVYVRAHTIRFTYFDRSTNRLQRGEVSAAGLRVQLR